MKYDPTLYENRAVAENSKEFMNNLKQIINDDAKISEIAKQLGTKAIFDINKYWPKFKDTILKIYGAMNNTNSFRQHHHPNRAHHRSYTIKPWREPYCFYYDVANAHGCQCGGLGSIACFLVQERQWLEGVHF